MNDDEIELELEYVGIIEKDIPAYLKRSKEVMKIGDINIGTIKVLFGKIREFFIYAEPNTEEYRRNLVVSQTYKGEYAYENDDNLIEISPELFKRLKEVLNECQKYNTTETSKINHSEIYDSNKFSFDFEKITEKELKEFKNRYIKMVDDGIKEILIEREEKKKEKEEEEKLREQKFKLEQQGILDYEGIQVTDKKEIFLKQKKINIVFDTPLRIADNNIYWKEDEGEKRYNLENNWGWKKESVVNMEHWIEKIKGFLLNCDITKNNNTLKVKFDNKKLKVNDIKCPKHIFHKVFEKWEAEPTINIEEFIKKIRSLGVRKLKLITELTHFRLGLGAKRNDYEIPISLNPIDDNNVEVKVGNQTKIIEWEKILKRFMSGNRVYNHINKWNFNEFLDLGFDKKELFDYFNEIYIQEQI